MNISLTEIIALLLQFKYWILFPSVVIEGPIVTILAGFLASLGNLDFWTAYLVVILGDLAGDTLFYFAGYYSGEKFITGWGKIFRIKLDYTKKIEKHFETHAGKTLILGKLSQGIGAAVLASAGIARMSFPKFILYNLVATIPKSYILILIGFHFGSFYNRINRYLDYTALISLALAIFFIAVYLIIKKITNKKSNL